MGILVCAYSNSCCCMIVQIPQSRTQTQEVEFFMDTMQWIPENWMGSKLKFVIQCLNVSITFDVIEHCKNMYSNDLTSLLPYLTPLLISYREKNEWSNELVIHSRLFQSRPSSKKASCEKDPTGFHHPRKQHHFISLCMLAVRGVLSGVGVYEFRG